MIFFGGCIFHSIDQIRAISRVVLSASHADQVLCGVLCPFERRISDEIQPFYDFINFLTDQGNFSSTTGLITLAMMLFGRQVFQKYGWGTAAQATPIVLLLTGVSNHCFAVSCRAVVELVVAAVWLVSFGLCRLACAA